MPYDYSYDEQDVDTDRTRMTEHYMIQLVDGHMCRVDYRADETGFQAGIVTNESAIIGRLNRLFFNMYRNHVSHYNTKYDGRRAISKWYQAEYLADITGEHRCNAYRSYSGIGPQVLRCPWNRFLNDLDNMILADLTGVLSAWKGHLSAIEILCRWRIGIAFESIGIMLRG